jgi:hypothetical protein
MPRLKIRDIVRVLGLVFVVCLFHYLTGEPWRSNAGLAYWRAGPASDVLGQVNLFIGTKNGGE